MSFCSSHCNLKFDIIELNISKYTSTWILWLNIHRLIYYAYLFKCRCSYNCSGWSPYCNLLIETTLTKNIYLHFLFFISLSILYLFVWKYIWISSLRILFPVYLTIISLYSIFLFTERFVSYVGNVYRKHGWPLRMEFLILQINAEQKS